EDSIAEELVENSAVGANDRENETEVAVEDGDDALAEAGGECAEADQIGVDDGDFAQLAVDAGFGMLQEVIDEPRVNVRPQVSRHQRPLISFDEQAHERA